MFNISGIKLLVPQTSGQPSAAAVEFAIVAPISLFFILYGIIDFGRMLMVQQIIVNAAREGARASINPGETDAQVSTIVTNYLAAANITGGTASLSLHRSFRAGNGNRHDFSS